MLKKCRRSSANGALSLSAMAQDARTVVANVQSHGVDNLKSIQYTGTVGMREAEFQPGQTIGRGLITAHPDHRLQLALRTRT
jgi:hypothetical protein